ncbi:hypothetical protein EG68_06489 [Paragonimus skrjabini miyazakii]|uniref:Uncharacterized protein n=1 Tax=Paragonimus skrjabini miyazakii TaxID=59628 RepID=A0A8S9YSL8_9TREM|nr:hypothetical protein EG68_06489 [Paragonimus skrjabini miyazakii]
MSSYVYIFAPFLLVAILVACSSAYCVYIYFSTRKLSKQIRAQMLARIIYGSQSNINDINVSNKYRPRHLTSLIAENTNRTDRSEEPQEEARQTSVYMNLGDVDDEQYSRSQLVQELPVFDQRPVEIHKQRHLPERYPSESMISSGARSEAAKDIRGRTDSYLSRYSDENYYRQESHQGYRPRSDARPGRAIPKNIR